MLGPVIENPGNVRLSYHAESCPLTRFAGAMDAVWIYLQRDHSTRSHWRVFPSYHIRCAGRPAVARGQVVSTRFGAGRRDLDNAGGPAALTPPRADCTGHKGGVRDYPGSFGETSGRETPV